MFFIWGSQLITSFLLFLVILTASYMHQYYKKDHTVVPTHDEDDAVDQAPDGGPPQHAVAYDDHNKNSHHTNQHSHGHNDHQKMQPVSVNSNEEEFFV